MCKLGIYDCRRNTNGITAGEHVTIENGVCRSKANSFSLVEGWCKGKDIGDYNDYHSHLSAAADCTATTMCRVDFEDKK